MDFGAYVRLAPGRDGLVHISQISEDIKNKRVEDMLSEGQKVKVKVLEVDRQGRIRLSMKAIHGDQLHSANNAMHPTAPVTALLPRRVMDGVSGLPK